MGEALNFSMLLLTTSLYILSRGATAMNMTVSLNPSCTLPSDMCQMPWLVHVFPMASKGSHPTTEYHHLWGGVGAPTLIAMQTPADANLSIDWDALQHHTPYSVQFSPAPHNVFGVAITEVILFDDARDEGSILQVNKTAQISLPSSLFEWNYTLSSDASQVRFSLFASAFNGTPFDNGTGLYIYVNSNADGFRAEKRPELFSPASAAAVDLILDHLIVNVSNPHPSEYPPHIRNHEYVAPISGFNSPRYALRLVFFSSETRNASFVHASDRSIDDEFAPGIFKLDSLTTDRARSHSSLPEGGYLQWRPVSYLSHARDVNEATLPTLSRPNDNSSEFLETTPSPASESVFDLLSSEAPSDLSPLDSISEELKQSLAFAVMGENLTSLLAVQTLVSFGSPEDGYYTTANYTVWSFTSGSGSPPNEGLSTNVLVVIIVGLGLPVLAMVVAGVSLAIWKVFKRGRNDHVALLTEET